MAGCKVMCDAAAHIEGAPLSPVMARNGTDFGIRVSAWATSGSSDLGRAT